MMLKQLTIKNLAIIDDISIDFENNFNVLSGETGAGKSIIIGALNLILGRRASIDEIRYDCESATIEALFYLNNLACENISQILNLDVEDELIIYRNININGRSICKINNNLVNVSTLSLIAPFLVDIHQQDESQYLLDSKNHLLLLDSYIKLFENNFLDEYTYVYDKYLKAKKELENLKNNNLNNYDLDYLNYQLSELKDYNYSLSDIEELYSEFKKMQNLEKNSSLIQEIIDEFSNENSVISQLYQLKRNFNRLESNDNISEYQERLDSAYEEINDIYSSFKANYSNINFDQNRYNFLQDEISKIKRLQRKFSQTDLLIVKNELLDRINKIENYENYLIESKNKVDELYKICLEKAKKINEIRNRYAIKLTEDIILNLKDLYLEESNFKIKITTGEMKKYGNDSVEFYLSTNKGMPLRPLIKVASGGEMSRIMLGLKSVFAKLNPVDSYIFDEIDTGVSGKVATAMGKKMLEISKTRQVLAITHLPQVVALGNYNYFISKKMENNITKTMVKRLNDDEKLTEIARLLSGDKITNNSLLLAKDLMNSK